MDPTAMPRELRILMLEDTPADAELAERELREAGIVFTSMRVETREAFVRALEEFCPDIILSDYQLPNFDGLAAVKIVRRDHPEVPVVMVTGALTDLDAVALIHAGAGDYVLKDRLARLAPAVQRVLSMEQGVRAREAAEQDLRASLTRYASVTENANDAIICMRPDGTIDLWNKMAQKMFGYSAEEAIGSTLHSVLAPARHGSQMSDGVLRFARTGTGPMMSKRLELTALRKDGTEFPVELSISAMDIGGNWHATGIVRDITERKQAEDLLRKSEQEFRTLAENSPDMVIRYDRDCRRFYVNPAYERETGVPASEALHRIPEAQWRRDMPAEEYRAVLQRVIESGVGTEIFMRGPAPDGQPADYAFHIVAERSPDGKVVGALAIGRNITTLKETERQLKESQRLLRQLAARSDAVREEERKALTREIHDEMGQYLSALRLGVSLIGLQFGGNNPALEEKTRDMVNLVDSTIKVVRNVVASLRPAALDMGIVSAMEWLVDEFIERSGIPCTLRVEGDIPLDEKRATALFRIVQESLTNISRHADATNVEIILERSDTLYFLEVQDNGKGFDPGIRKKKSFGLVGIRERALALGGEADISSACDGGTMVKVCFPINNVLVES